MRGLGLPGCGRGVTVPISKNPNPNAASASICLPSLSKPAANPTGLGKSMPQSVCGSLMGLLTENIKIFY
jgi:hypothetical protein